MLKERPSWRSHVTNAKIGQMYINLSLSLYKYMHSPVRITLTTQENRESNNYLACILYSVYSNHLIISKVRHERHALSKSSCDEHNTPVPNHVPALSSRLLFIKNNIFFRILLVLSRQDR